MNGDFKKVVVGRQAAEFAASAKARRGEVVSHILGKGCAKGRRDTNRITEQDHAACLATARIREGTNQM